MLRTKGEQKAYLDGYEMCAECIEEYLSAEGKQKLECLLSAVRNAVEIENTEDKKDNGHKKGKEDNRCGNCVHWKSYEFCNHWKDQHCENKNSPYYLKDTQADTRCFEFEKGGEE